MFLQVAKLFNSSLLGSLISINLSFLSFLPLSSHMFIHTFTCCLALLVIKSLYSI